MPSALNSDDSQPIRTYYEDRVAECDRRLELIEHQSLWLSRLRGLTFISAVGMAVFGWTADNHLWLWLSGAGILFMVFVSLAIFHETILQQAIAFRHRRSMNRIQLARLRRQWSQIPEQELEVPPEHQSVSRDLDLFGRSSLFQLISLARTPFGRDTLRDWLLQPAIPEEIAARQEAVSILKQRAKDREELNFRGRLLGNSESSPLRFVQWAEGPAWLAERSWLMWITRLLTAGAILLFVLAFSGAVDTGTAWLGFLLVLVANMAVNVVYAGQVHEIFKSVSTRNHDIQHYRPLMKMIADLPPKCRFFDQLKRQMGNSPQEPLQRLRSLTRIVNFANLRRNGFLGILYIISQVLLLTDFHVLWVLEVWQRRHGRVVRGWLEAVGQLEAISSLAGLAHDHPDWTLPTIQDDAQERVLEAKSLGHPLLPDEACVRNDVSVGPSDTFLLVTGSNMSGKSTLLRSIGVNVALGQAGGPVCAEKFRLPRLQIATSMRIHDSLADGVSFFMAELKRLKQIVDEGTRVEKRTDGTLLYLLDEILQGTNSAERHIAVSRVITHLVKQKAIGVVSTHDVELASDPALAEACRTVHFRETIAGEGAARQMTFDYKMRPGLATTTNALQLLELVGLVETGRG